MINKSYPLFSLGGLVREMYQVNMSKEFNKSYLIVLFCGSREKQSFQN